MIELKSIINLLSKQKLKQIEIITEEDSLSDKSKQLYVGIKNGKYLTDEDASLDIYNEDPKNETYRKLKYRLQERLLNTLFFIDIQQYAKSNYEKALNRAYKNWSLNRILIEKGLRKVGVNLIENSLKACLKYDVIDLTVQITNSLKINYGLFNYNAYKFEKYSKLYKESLNKYLLENEATHFYTILAHYVISSKSIMYDDKIKAIEYELIELYNKAKDVDIYFLQYYMLNALYFLNMIKKDNIVLDQICDNAIDYFSKKIGFPNQGIFSFYQKKAITQLSLGNFESAIKYFNTCLDYKPTEGGITWQYLHNYIFHTQIIKKNYDEALKVIVKILGNKNFHKINETFKQPWYLKEAFIHFLIKIEKIDLDTAEIKGLRQFRLSRFVNEVSEFSKDKRGLNITINIIQMLFLIIDNEYDKVLDKLAALKQYNFRYLKRPEYIRSSTFIKMLLKIPDENYNKANVINKTEKLHKLLLDNPSDFSEQTLNIEIIPYEQLWEEILNILE